MPRARRTNHVITAVRLALVIAAIIALWEGNWSASFVSTATLILTYLPQIFADRFGIRLPVGFSTAIVLFIFATLFLGEVLDFYNRYWWWDIALHGGSAIGFGLIGTLFVLMLFEGDRYAAPPIAIAFISWCFALSIGALWEIFEYAMDQTFGMNMQKSGLVDTMWDLIVDAVGGAIGAAAGFLYLKGREIGGLGAFVAQNRRWFRKAIGRIPRQ